MSHPSASSSRGSHADRSLRPSAFLQATWRQLVAIHRSRAVAATLARATADDCPSRSTSVADRRVLVVGDSMALDWGAAGRGLVGRIARDHPTATIVRLASGG